MACEHTKWKAAETDLSADHVQQCQHDNEFSEVNDFIPVQICSLEDFVNHITADVKAQLVAALCKLLQVNDLIAITV